MAGLVLDVSPFRSLSIHVGPESYRSPIAMLRSYWDDSGSKYFCTMVGYVATTPQWESFDRKWEDVLGNFKVTAAHMTDFVASQGEFVGWIKEKRIAFVSQLAGVMSQSDLRGLCSSVHIQALGQCNARWGNAYSPYAVTAALCMAEFREYYGPEQTGECFLDRITNGRRELDAAEQLLSRDPLYREWWAQERVSWRHLTKSEMNMRIRGKEAADFAAWEARSNAEGIYGLSKSWIGGHWSMMRMSAVSLMEATPINGRVHSVRELDALFARASGMMESNGNA